MYIRFNRSLRGDYGRAKPGDVKLVSKEIAKSLINRGLAEECAAPDPTGERPTPEQLEALLFELVGKTAEEVGTLPRPALHDLLAYLESPQPKNASTSKLAGALVEVLVKRTTA